VSDHGPDPTLVLPQSAGAIGEICVREWEPADAQGLTDAVRISHAHLHPWMPWVEQPPLSVSERLGWMREMRERRCGGGDAIYGILFRGQAAGGCGLHQRIGEGGLEIGYWVRADLVRRGIATTAVRILTAAAFALPQIERVEIHHDKANTASGRVAAAAGYRLVAEHPREPEAPGESGVECRWLLTRDQLLASP
jgi:ribosomal-protein-serine acetyltransferase